MKFFSTENNLVIRMETNREREREFENSPRDNHNNHTKNMKISSKT